MKLSPTCLVEIVDDTAFLLPARSRHSHDTLDETTAFLALSSEADFAPQNSLTDSPFCIVVRRLDSFVIDESPKVLLFCKETLAHAGHRAHSADLSLDEKIANLDTQLCHPATECFAGHGPIPDLVPPLKHEFGSIQQSAADTFGFSLHLGKAPESSNQVRPTKLAQTGVDTVWRPPVRAQNAAKVSQQLPRCSSAPAEMNHEYRYRRRNRHPQPGLLVALAPAGFVGVHHSAFLCMTMSLGNWFLDGLADFLLAGRNRSEAHIDTKYICHEAFDKALALMVDPGQQRDHHGCLRAEVSTRNPRWQFGLCDVPAVLAGARDHLPFGDDRLDLWDFPYLMAPRIGVVDNQVNAAALFADARPDDAEMIHFVGWRQFSVASLVAMLCAAFAFGFLLATATLRLGCWRVARRRLG